MKNAYKMITLQSYIRELDDKNVVSLTDKSLEQKVEAYLLSRQRAASNVKIVEALLA